MVVSGPTAAATAAPVPTPARRLIARVEALRRERPERAWRAVARGFAAAARAASPAERGELWRVRGHVLRGLRRAAEAAAAYRRAERWYARAGSARERGRCAIGLVDALMYLGRYAEARAVARRGRRLLEAAGDRVSLGRLLNNEANLFHRLDLPERALERYRAARRALERAGDPLTVSLIGTNIGNCLSLLGRCEEARAHYADAGHAAREAGRPLDALRADYNLAYLEFLEQRFEAALESLGRVADEARARGVPSIAALAALDRAEILLRLGVHEDAAAEALAAEAACGALGLGYERAKAGTFAALAEFRLGHAAGAAERLERAIAAFHDEGNAVWTGEALVGLATVWERGGQPLAAVALLRAARLHFERAGDREREGCARALLARTAAAAGDRRAARRAARGLAPRLARRASPRFRHLALAALAAVARAGGDEAGARRALRRAAAEAEHLAARILDEQWRASFWGEWGWPHVALAALELDAGAPARALEALERGRGRALLGAAPSARRGRAIERRVRAWAAAAFARDRARGARSGAAVASAPPEPPAAARGLDGAGEVGARAIRRALPAGTLLLDWFGHDGWFSSLAVDADGVAGHPRLARADQALRLAHAALFSLRGAAYAPREERAAASPGLAGELESLAALLLWPALAGRPLPRALALAPPGPLARLPWAALPLPDGRALCEACAIAVVPGLRLGLARREARRPSGAPLVVAVDAGDLDHVDAETRAVAAAFPGATVLRGAEATSERFLALAPAAPWIHFAGHGIYRPDSPYLSGLRFHDRWLPAAELSHVPLGAGRVVLAACQTARALVRPGEEWLGLARTLLRAGAGSVLAAQWDVDDEATRDLMAALYPRLAAGEPAAAALAAAQAGLGRAGVHPMDWAGFVILGGPDVGRAA